MRSALLVVDVQQGMFMPPTPAFEGEAVVARITGLLARARARELPVFHVQHDGGPGDLLGKPGIGWEIRPEVAPRTDEPVIGKSRCCAFPGTALDAHLKLLGITRIVVAGMQTEYCIDTNCRAAADLGYKVVLAKDGHTTFDTPVLSAAQIIARFSRSVAGGTSRNG